MEKKQILNKVWKITATVLLYVFIAVCIFGVILTLASKKDPDGTATVFGMQMRVVLSPSMEKCDATDVSDYDIKDIPVKSMVFIQTVPKDKEKAEKWYESLKKGDVLTFKYVYVKQETITHRIIDIDKDGLIYLAGDNKSDDGENLVQVIDPKQENSPNYIIGKVVGQSYIIGLFISVLQSTVGIICVIILPALAIMIYEVIKIVNMFASEKQKKAEEEKKQQQDEIEELKRKLAELQNNKNSIDGNEPNNE